MAKEIAGLKLAFLQIVLFCIPVLGFAQLPTVNITLNDGIASEAGQATGSFNVSRTGSTTGNLKVKVVVSGTATMTQDYIPDPPMGWIGSNVYQVDIPTGQTSETILITPVQDGLNEGDESVIFTLTGDATYTVGPNAGSELTIEDDSPVVDLTVSDGAISESGPNPGSFLVTRSGGILTKALKIKVVVSGTATITQDYNPDPLMGWLGSNIYQMEIPAGQDTETILITPVQDGLNEGDESVIFTLTGDTTYTVGPNAGSELTIEDDSPVVSLTVGAGTSFESRANPGNFIATRSGGVLTKALKIKVVVTGTATMGQDYNLSPAIGWLGSNIYQIEIPPNKTTETFLIEAIEDGIVEDDETAIFTLTGDTIYTIGEPVSASITISDYVEGIFKDSFENP